MRHGGRALALSLLATTCTSDDPALPRRPHLDQDFAVVTDDGVRLTGVLSLPDAERNRLPAVIVIGGSGAQDRDGARADLPGYRPHADLAYEIGRSGLVVLRLDDRGAGASEGSAAGTTTTRSALDVAGAIAALRGHERVDSNRIGLVGHSEGALVALLAAANDSTIRTLVLLASPSRSGREVARWQRDWLTASDRAQFPAEHRRQLLAEAEQVAESTAAVDPWMREWFALEPRVIARRFRGHALVVHGEQDRQVPVEQADELTRALREGGARVDVVRVPLLNHLLLEDPDGDPRHYMRLANRRIPRALRERIAGWLAQRS